MINDENTETTVVEKTPEQIVQELYKFMTKLSDGFEDVGVPLDFEDPINCLDTAMERLVVYHSQVEYVMGQLAPNRRVSTEIIKIGGDIQHLVSMERNKLEAVDKKRIAVRYHLRTIQNILACDFSQLTHAQRNGINKALGDIVQRALNELSGYDDMPF